MSVETVSKGFTELFRNGFSLYDETVSILLILNFIKWNPVVNPNMGKSIAKQIEELPKNFKYVEQLRASIESFANYLPNGFETVWERFDNHSSKVQPIGLDLDLEKEKDSNFFCAEPKKILDSTPEMLPENVFLEIPTNMKGRIFVVTEEQVREWEPVYPALDVKAEVRMAAAWLDANPANRKTLRGMKRFLVGWLNRSQDKAKRLPGPPEKPDWMK